MANYKVYEKAKKIVADVAELTDKELRAVNNYQVLGYKLVGKKEKDETKETAKRVNTDYIVNVYLKDDEEAKEEFSKNKGVKALQWFKETYPKDVKEYNKIVDIVEKALGKKDKPTTIEEMYKAYNKKATDEKKDKIQTKEEYIRCYYWNKIFTR